jgi:hypothetical protein
MAGGLKRKGFGVIHFDDAMTHHIDGESLRAELAELYPDLVGVTFISPLIYAVQELPGIAQQVVPNPACQVHVSASAVLGTRIIATAVARHRCPRQYICRRRGHCHSVAAAADL